MTLLPTIDRARCNVCVFGGSRLSEAILYIIIYSIEFLDDCVESLTHMHV